MPPVGKQPTPAGDSPRTHPTTQTNAMFLLSHLDKAGRLHLGLCASPKRYEYTAPAGDIPENWKRQDPTLPGPRLFGHRDLGICLLWAGGPRERGIFVQTSADLRSWSRPSRLEIQPGPGASARPHRPSCYWDSRKQLYRMVWTCLRQDSTDLRGVWTASSRDFRRWTHPVLLFDPGYPVAEPVVAGQEGSYRLAFTDMRGEDRPDTYFRAIRIASGPEGAGPFLGISALLTPKLTRSGALVRDTKGWTLVYERTDTRQLEALRATEGNNWKPHTAPLALPGGRLPSACALPEGLDVPRG